ncbi:MAG TPA: hypothetical protein VHD76_07465 [Bryobacteraceae bacterium]|jgi:hypothetical protein|nr:hypothetical protein [Bryobacteraceae bacterium]
MLQSTQTEIQIWPIDRLVHYARNPRKQDKLAEAASKRKTDMPAPTTPEVPPSLAETQPATTILQ